MWRGGESNGNGDEHERKMTRKNDDGIVIDDDDDDNDNSGPCKKVRSNRAHVKKTMERRRKENEDGQTKKTIERSMNDERNTRGKEKSMTKEKKLQRASCAC